MKEYKIGGHFMNAVYNLSRILTTLAQLIPPRQFDFLSRACSGVLRQRCAQTVRHGSGITATQFLLTHFEKKRRVHGRVTSSKRRAQHGVALLFDELELIRIHIPARKIHVFLENVRAQLVDLRHFETVRKPGHGRRRSAVERSEIVVGIAVEVATQAAGLPAEVVRHVDVDTAVTVPLHRDAAVAVDDDVIREALHDEFLHEVRQRHVFAIHGHVVFLVEDNLEKWRI